MVDALPRIEAAAVAVRVTVVLPLVDQVQLVWRVFYAPGVLYLAIARCRRLSFPAVWCIVGSVDAAVAVDDQVVLVTEAVGVDAHVTRDLVDRGVIGVRRVVGDVPIKSRCRQVRHQYGT